MLELLAGTIFPTLDPLLTRPRRWMTWGSWMIGFLLVFALASLVGCSVEAASVWWLSGIGEEGFVDILRVCCFLVSRLYCFDAVLSASALCCLMIEIVARKLLLLAGLLLVMCLVIGGDGMLRHGQTMWVWNQGNVIWDKVRPGNWSQTPHFSYNGNIDDNSQDIDGVLLWLMMVERWQWLFG